MRLILWFENISILTDDGSVPTCDDLTSFLGVWSDGQRPQREPLFLDGFLVHVNFAILTGNHA